MTEGAFEARKISYRQTKDGMVIAFAIHPNDAPLDLLNAPIGTVYAIGFREMPEGDQSARVSPPADAGHGSDLPVAPTPAVASPEGTVVGDAPKPKRPMTRAQVAGMLCNNPVFHTWWWKRGPELQNGAALNAACEEEDWPQYYAIAVRQHCGVTSRAELDTNEAAAGRWDALHARYRAETGQEAEAR